MPLARVRLIPAGADALYGNVATMVASLPFPSARERAGPRDARRAKAGQWVVAKVARELGINVTGGSSSVVDALGRAAPGRGDRARATARRGLDRLEAAGRRARRHATASSATPSGSRAHYGELATHGRGDAERRGALKRREDWKLIGTAAPRIDVAAKSNGAARLRHRRAPAGPALRGDPPLPDARRQRRRGRRRAGADARRRRARRAPRPLRRLDRGARRRRPHLVACAARRRRRSRSSGGSGRRARSTARRSWPRSKRSARAAADADGGFAFHSRGDVAAADAGSGAPRRAGLPRALPRARDDGADQLHRARRRRQGRGLGADAGARARARDRRRRSPASPKTRSRCTSPISAAASAAASTSTSSARRCASRSRPAAGRCSSSGRARKT